MIKNNTIFKVENFEGPLDLLLELIREKKLDILKTSLVEITDQYIEFIEGAKQVNLELAGEYFLIAAQLIELKVKHLLKLTMDKKPHEEKDEDDELLQKLITLNKYKDLSQKLQRKFEENLVIDKHDEGFEEFVKSKNKEIKLIAKKNPIELYQIFSKIVENVASTVKHEKVLTIKKVFVEERKKEVIELIQQAKKKISFRELVKDNMTKFNLIITFLVILELIRSNNLNFEIDEKNTDIIIYKD